MQINLQGKNIELTQEIKDYVQKRITNLEKLLKSMEGQGEAIVRFDLQKSTNHNKGGNLFHADCLIKINGEEFYAGTDGNDWMQVIDELKDKLYSDIGRNKNHKQTMFRRGARSVKKMLKGLSKRNPFTSKY